MALQMGVTVQCHVSLTTYLLDCTVKLLGNRYSKINATGFN